MPLGYVPTVQQILAYYGEERPEVERALSRAANGRAIEFYDWPTTLAWSGKPDDRLAPHILRHLEANLRPCLPDDVPARYPGIHAKIGRDIVLEVDYKKSQRVAFESGKRLRDFLEGYGAPYRVKFSGNCSAHFVIPQDVYEPLLSERERETAFPRLYRWFLRQLQDAVEGKLDDSFDDEEHYLRLPYSLNEATGLVSLPIRPEGYDAFEPAMAEMQNVRVESWWFEREDLLARREGMQRLLHDALRKGTAR
jgi:hypothetical protein